MNREVEELLKRWASEQRALAKTLGLSIDDWLSALEAASTRRPALMAAIIGAGARVGLGLSVIDGLDTERLLADARQLIDPAPPRVSNPLLKEAIRRAEELGAGVGAGRLRSRPSSQASVRTEDIPRPTRGDSFIGPSDNIGTADAPGTRTPSDE